MRLSHCNGLLLQMIVVSASMVAPSWASQAAGQETLLGIVGKDFILLGADSSVRQGVALTVSNRDKIATLVDPRVHVHSSLSPSPPSFGSRTRSSRLLSQQQQCIAAAVAGDEAMSDRLIGLLQAQATLQEYEAGVGADVHFVTSSSSSGTSKEDATLDDEYDDVVEAGVTVRGMAYLARSQLSSIRPNANVCLLLAGMMMTQEDEDETDRREPSNESIVLSSSLLSSRQSPPHHVVQQQAQQAWKPMKSETTDEAAVPTMESSATAESSSSPFSLTSPPRLSLSSSSSPSLQPHLYWLDELGSLQQIPYGAHGLGSNFCWSVLDQGFHKDMTLDEATHLMKECFHQLRTRYLINSPQPPCIKVVDVHGIRRISI
jgi:Proteasome subunit